MRQNKHKYWTGTLWWKMNNYNYLKSSVYLHTFFVINYIIINYKYYLHLLRRIFKPPTYIGKIYRINTAFNSVMVYILKIILYVLQFEHYSLSKIVENNETVDNIKIRTNLSHNRTLKCSYNFIYRNSILFNLRFNWATKTVKRFSHYHIKKHSHCANANKALSLQRSNIWTRYTHPQFK